jgi:protein phosphatase
LKILYAARSHTGYVRRGNEDNLYCDGVTMTPEARETPFSVDGEAEPPCVFAVFDGMGGESEGEFASLAAALVLAEHTPMIRSASSKVEVDSAVQSFVREANGVICDAMRARSVRMGTTAALIIAAGGTVYPYSLGDSRIYAMMEGKLSQISEDHTLSMQKARMGIITEEEARMDRDRNKLTLHLGIFEDEMTIEASAAAPLTAGRACRMMLCSDGLTDMVANERMEEIMRGARSPDDAAGLLVASALENGGRDNVTCVVLDLPFADGAQGSEGFFHKLRRYLFCE